MPRVWTTGRRGFAVGLGLLVATPFAATPAAQTRPLGGLDTYSLPKPAAPARDPVAADVTHRPPAAPPPLERLRLSAGLGYVQGADWGARLGGAGRLGPVRIDLSALVTAGHDTMRLDQGRLFVGAPDARWTVEAGDLFSSLAGPGRGLQVGWAAGDRRPSLLYLVPAFTESGQGPLLAYRDRWQFGEVATLEGQLATTGAHLVTARWSTGGGSVDATYRRLADTRDLRVGGALRPWKRLEVRASVTRSVRQQDVSLWQTLGLRVPVTDAVDVTVERTVNRTAATRHDTWTTLADVTGGGLHLIHRHQWGHLAREGTGVPVDLALQQTQSLASYRAGRHLRLTLQLAGQWTAAGRVRQWDELGATWQPWPGTTVAVAAAVPHLGDTNRLRARLSQALPSAFRLDLEFGRPAPYQLTTTPERTPRFRVIVSRTWTMAAPGTPRAVDGRVVDQAGRPVGGVRVRLGRYTVDADAVGHFVFPEVPSGRYELALESTTLPAHVGWNGDPIVLDLRRGRAVSATLQVAPLDSVTGRVCLDRDRTGRCGPDSGVAGLALRLDGDRTTATGPDGRFAFYNVWPGAHRVALDAATLGTAYLALGRLETAITVSPGSPATGVTFLVAPRARAIRWSALAP